MGTFRARGRKSGIEAEIPLGVIVTFEHGIVTVVWSTADPSEALEAASLSE
jgi:hypothetical protein